jgi:hypothetical protein
VFSDAKRLFQQYLPKAEVIKPHSITSSAVESSSYGMDIPNALAVF